MHRWDAEHAAGTPAPIDAELAVDGIDELLTVMVPIALGGKDGIDIGGSLHVHCTDGEGEWTLHTDDGVYRVERGHAKGDAAVRGPASQLLLALWGRVSIDADGPGAVRRHRRDRPLARAASALSVAQPRRLHRQPGTSDDARSGAWVVPRL